MNKTALLVLAGLIGGNAQAAAGAAALPSLSASSLPAGMPSAAALPSAPSASALPGLPDLSASGGAPALPGLPGASALPGLPSPGSGSAGLTLSTGLQGPAFGPASPLPSSQTVPLPGVGSVNLTGTNNDGAGHSVLAVTASVQGSSPAAGGAPAAPSAPALPSPGSGSAGLTLNTGVQGPAFGPASPLPSSQTIPLPGVGSVNLTGTNNDGAGHSVLAVTASIQGSPPAAGGAPAAPSAPALPSAPAAPGAGAPMADASVEGPAFGPQQSSLPSSQGGTLPGVGTLALAGTNNDGNGHSSLSVSLKP